MVGDGPSPFGGHEARCAWVAPAFRDAATLPTITQWAGARTATAPVAAGHVELAVLRCFTGFQESSVADNVIPLASISALRHAGRTWAAEKSRRCSSCRGGRLGSSLSRACGDVMRRSLRRSAVLGLLGPALLCSCRDPLPPAIEAPVPTAPGTVQDLQALPPPATENFYAIVLQWTVPIDPDDPTEPPWLYEVRYDSHARSGEEWLTAPGVFRRNFSKPPGTIQRLPIGPLTPGKLYFFALRSKDSHDYWSGWSNSVSFTVNNLSPVPAFSIAGDASCTEAPVHFDASACTDPEDRVEALQVRWDWESDSVWDTPWSTTKFVDHTYSSPGRRTVTMQVRDRAGATNQIAHRTDPLTVVTAYRMVGLEVRLCCTPGPRGSCAQWCIVLSSRSQAGLGPWDYYAFTDVSQDSILFMNLEHHSLPGFQIATADVTLRVCEPVAIHMAGGGAITVEVSGPAGPIFPVVPRTPSADFEFDGTLPAGRCAIHIVTRDPGRVRITFDDPPPGVP